MTRIITPIRCCKMITGTSRNGWPVMPLTISLAVSGISIQVYASYMMIKASSYHTSVLPLMNYETQNAI